MSQSLVMLTVVPHGYDAANKSVLLSVFVTPKLWSNNRGPFSDWTNYVAQHPTFKFKINGTSCSGSVRNHLSDSLWEALNLGTVPVSDFNKASGKVKSYDSAAVKECVRKSYGGFLRDQLPDSVRPVIPVGATPRSPFYPPVAGSFSLAFAELHSSGGPRGTAASVEMVLNPPSVSLDDLRDLSRIAGRPVSHDIVRDESQNNTVQNVRAANSGEKVLNPLVPLAAVTGRIARTACTVTPSSGETQRLDFHQCLALLTNYVPIMRQLGLILDFEISMGNLLPQNQELHVSVDEQALGNLPVVAHVTVAQSLDDGFWPACKDGSIKHGFVGLNAKDYHLDIASLESAGTMLFAFANQLDRRNTDSVTNAGSPASNNWGSQPSPPPVPPSLTTAGISLWRHNRAKLLQDKIEKAKSTPDDAVQTLYAEDLTASYAIDLKVDIPGGVNRWFCLTRRQERYYFNEKAIGEPETRDTGVRTSAVRPTDKLPEELKAADQFFVTDAVFTWDGPGLGVHRTGGSTLKDPGTPRTLEKVPWKLRSEFTLPDKGKDGSPFELAPFRIGGLYGVAMRPVFLTGEATPFNKDRAIVLDLEGPVGRLEPIHPPRILLREEISEKDPVEKPEVLVIRSSVEVEKDGTIATSREGGNCVRYLMPAAVTLKLARLHTPKEEFGNLLRGFRRLRFDDKGDLKPIVEKYFAPADQPYLPDPMAQTAILRLSTLTGLALGECRVPFYSDQPNETWPDCFLNQVEVKDSDLDVPTLTPSAGSADSKPGLTLSSQKVEILMPPGWTCLLTVSFVLNESQVNQMEVWQWYRQAHPNDDLVSAQKYIQDGLHSMVTPTRTLRVIHAVTHPLEIPKLEFKNLFMQPLPTTRDLAKEKLLARPPGVAPADLSLKAVYDLKSSGKLQFHANWSEWIDDPQMKSPVLRSEGQVLLDYLAPQLGKSDDKYQVLQEAREGEVQQLFAVVQNFKDTKYRRVRYSLIAGTRYSAHFPDSATGSQTSPPVDVEVLNASRPDPPKVSYVLPFYDWHREKNKHQRSFTHRRRMGLRVYLERPWFSSGDDELLGVVVRQSAGQAEAISKGDSVRIDNSLAGLDVSTADRVSLWGGDPIWDPPGKIAVNDGPKLNGWSQRNVWAPSPSIYATKPPGVDLRFEANNIGACGSELKVPNFPAPVTVVGYRPEFDEVRGTWYCDLPFEAGPSYGTFVKLALTRYQPHSIPGQELSEVVVTEFALLNPDRVVEVRNISPRSFEIIVTGTANTGAGERQNTFEVALEALVLKGETELGWKEVQLIEADGCRKSGELWKGTVTPKEYCARRRIVIREFEYFECDRDDQEDDGTAVAELANGRVRSVQVTAGGQEYDDTASIEFSKGTQGRAAGRIRTIEGRITGVEITDPGCGYEAAPQVWFRRNMARRLVYADVLELS